MLLYVAAQMLHIVFMHSDCQAILAHSDFNKLCGYMAGEVALPMTSVDLYKLSVGAAVALLEVLYHVRVVEVLDWLMCCTLRGLVRDLYYRYSTFQYAELGIGLISTTSRILVVFSQHAPRGVPLGHQDAMDMGMMQCRHASIPAACSNSRSMACCRSWTT